MVNRITNYIRGQKVLAVLSLVGIVGSILLWVNTQNWGVGVGYDSYFYISAADNFLNGVGLGRISGSGELIPLIHFPPAYPIFLVGISLLFQETLLNAARISASIFLGINILLIGALIYKNTKSALAGFMGSFFALLSPFLLEVHLMAMAEPFFLIILMLATYFLALYMQNRELRILIFSGSLAGIAVLIRYASMSIIVTGILVILVFLPEKFIHKIKIAFFYSLSSAIIFVPWLIRNWSLSGSFTNRTLFFHLPMKEKLIEGIYVMATWLSPTITVGVLATGKLAIAKLVVVLIVITIGLILYLKRDNFQAHKIDRYTRGNYYEIVLIIFITIYILFLFLSLSLFDASTPLNNRILSPIYVSGIILGIISIWKGYSINSSRIYQFVFLSVLLFFLSQANFVRFQLVSQQMRNKGLGFTNREWQNSGTIAEIKKLPDNIILYSNEPYSIYLLAGRESISIPEKYDPVKLQENASFASSMERMSQVFNESQGALILFDSYYNREIYASEQKLTKGLYLWKDTNDGAIYFPEGVMP